MHWLPRELALVSDNVWRADLLGGGRALAFAERLKKFPTISGFAAAKGWDHGEGYIVAEKGRRVPGKHITGRRSLPSDAISEQGIVESRIRTETATLFRSPYTPRRFSPPMILIHEQFNLNHDMWTKSYLTYQNQIVGICANEADVNDLRKLHSYLIDEKRPLRAFVAVNSVKLFTQHATTLSGVDILNLPYPLIGGLRLSAHERILVADIVDYYRDLIRLGEDSAAAKEPGAPALPAFNEVFTSRISGVYKKNKLRALEAHAWPGVICQPYVFGAGKIDWDRADQLRGKVDALLREKRGGGLGVTRIARLYDGACVYLLKPNRLRYWLRSIALRDADETLADLSQQGF